MRNLALMMEKKVLNITLICKKHSLKEEENVFLSRSPSLTLKLSVVYMALNTYSCVYAKIGNVIVRYSF